MMKLREMINISPQSAGKLRHGEFEGPVAERQIACQAVEDVCWLYLDRNLDDNLRRHGWREARRNVLRQGPLSGAWTSSHRGHPPVRLTRRGVEVNLQYGVKRFGWERMQDQIRARRY